MAKGFTMIALLKRRQGMSKAEFIDYYETFHRKIGERVMAGYATGYVRRFLTPVDGEDLDSDVDVLTEMTFPDRAARDACIAYIQSPEVLPEVIADEERLFDRSRIRMFDVEERVSALPPLKTV